MASGQTTRRTKGGRLARQAAIACNDHTIRLFLADVYGIFSSDAADTAAAVRQICGPDFGKPTARPLASRADLDHDPDAAIRWHALKGEFENWRDGL